MLTSEEIAEVEAVKSPAVRKMLDEWTMFVESPVSETYLAVLNKLNTWNEVLQEPDDNSNLKDADKKFEREMKMVLEADNIHAVLEKLFARMTDEEKEATEAKSMKALGRNSKINDKRIAV